MSEQADLFSPRTEADEVDALVLILRDCGWMTAREILCFRPDWTDRKIRAIANASQGQVISGQKGYRLTIEATPEEIQHAADWLIHQGQQMARRGIEIRRFAHGRIG